MQILNPQTGAFPGHGVYLHNDLQNKGVNLQASKISGVCMWHPKIQMLSFCPQMYMAPAKSLMLNSAEKLLLLYTQTHQSLLILMAQEVQIIFY